MTVYGKEITKDGFRAGERERSIRILQMKQNIDGRKITQ